MPFPPQKKDFQVDSGCIPLQSHKYFQSEIPSPQRLCRSKANTIINHHSQVHSGCAAPKPTLFSIRTSNSTAADTASAAAFPFFNRGARTRSETRHGQRRGVCCKKLGAVHPFSCATSHGFGTILGACCLEGRLYATGHPLHL